jgi:hypothetical protein
MRHRDTCTGSETPNETMAETVSLKSLARLVLERDSARDKERDRGSRRCPATVGSVRRIASLRVAATNSVGASSTHVVQMPDGEPGLDHPCAARRGQLQELNGAFLHFCCQCGRFGAFGYGVRLRAGRFGSWYCGEHRPGSEVTSRACYK